MATIPGVSDGELIRTTWGDAVADELNGNTVKKTLAQTIAGPVTVTTSLTTGGGMISGGRITCNGDYVSLPTQSAVAAAATRRDYVDAQVADVRADSVPTAGGEMTGALYIGGFPPSGTNDGISLLTSGGAYSSVTTGGTTTTSNIGLSRAGTGGAQDVGGRYVRFDRTTAGTVIGSITIASASSVAYNTTSDPRLKQVTGDVDDAATIVHDLGAKAFRGRWIADQNQGQEWVFLNSTDIAEVAPYAVTGAADAVDGDGNVDPQQVNYPALVPMLVAALSQALDRIAALEAAT